MEPSGYSLLILAKPKAGILTHISSNHNGVSRLS